MFEYTCPQCHTTNRVPTAPSGKVTTCPDCEQPLRLVTEEEAGVSSVSGVYRSRRTKTRGWGPPLLALAGGLGGLTAAALLLLVWFFAGRGPAPTRKGRELEPIKDWVVAAGPDKVARADKGGPADKGAKSDPPAGGQKEGDPDPPVPAPTVPEVKVLNQEDLYDRLLQSVCWIATADGHGSGTLVDRDERLVLTNEHVANQGSRSIAVLFPIRRNGKVVKKNKDYLLEIRRGNGIKAKVVRVDRRRDLTLLQLERLPEGVMPVRLAARGVRPGQKVHTVGGNPEGNDGQWIYSPGRVRQVLREEWQYQDGYPREAERIASDMPINRGDSGGGLVDDRCHLVGVNCAFKEGRANTRHIDITEVIDFLKRYFKEDKGKDWAPPVDEPTPGADRQVAALLEALEAPGKESRQKALQGLALLGPDAKKAIPVLLTILRNRGEPEEAREAAAETLYAIGSPGREQAQAVIGALSDKESPEARYYAAAVLGPVAAKLPDAVAALIMALRDKDVKVRVSASLALGSVGLPARDKAEPELVGLLRDPEKDVRRAALKALSQFGRPAGPDTAREKATLADRSAPVEARMYACAMLSLEGEDVAPVISEVLSADTDADLAIEVVVVLADLKVKKKEVGLALSRALDHKVERVHLVAAGALARIGFDPTLMPAFLKALASPEAGVRKLALDQLPSFSTFNKELPPLDLTRDSLDSIKAALASKERAARWVAAYALGTLGAEGAGGAAALLAALRKETVGRVRLEMLSAFALLGPAALKEMGDKADDLLDELAEVTADPREDNRLQQTCAALALLRLAPPKAKQGPKAIPVLARALLMRNAAGPDPQEQELHERAKKALVKAGKPAALAVAKVLSTSFLGDKRDTRPVAIDKILARKTAFEVLARIGTPDANIPEVKFVLNRFAALAKVGQEVPEVIQAAREAAAAINFRFPLR